MGYYQAQAARALSYEKSSMATSVVYATQFHNLVAGIFAAGSKLGVIPAFKGVSFQPISTADVARVLVEQAQPGGDDAGGSRSVIVGGPEARTMKELALEWKDATGSGAIVAGMPLPGSFGAFLRAGKNLVPEYAVGQETFGSWLSSRGGR